MNSLLRASQVEGQSGMVVRPLYPNLLEKRHTCQLGARTGRMWADDPAACRSRRGGPLLIARLAHSARSLRRDLVDDAHLTGPPIRIAVHSEVLLAQAVNVGVPALLRDLHDPAEDAEVAVGIGRIDDGQRDRWVSPHVAVLDPPLCRVHAEELT